MTLFVLNILNCIISLHYSETLQQTMHKALAPTPHALSNLISKPGFYTVFP